MYLRLQRGILPMNTYIKNAPLYKISLHYGKKTYDVNNFFKQENQLEKPLTKRHSPEYKDQILAVPSAEPVTKASV
jgi:hypothetical protein